MKISQSGKIISIETRRKISIANSGINNYFYGKHFSGSSHPRYGKKHSEITKKQISESNKGKFKLENNPKSRKVICLTTNMIFNTVLEAGVFYNINYTCISHCCRGRNKTSGKHPESGEKLVWMYYDEYKTQQTK